MKVSVILAILVAAGSLWFVVSYTSFTDPEAGKVVTTRGSDKLGTTSSTFPVETEFKATDHGQIRLEARAQWAEGREGLTSYIRSLPPDPDRLVAITGLRKYFSSDPKLFAELIELLPHEASRNSIKELLLNQLAFDRSPREAIDFVFENTGVGLKRSAELYPLYASWFKTDPEGAINDAAKLELPSDKRAFADVLSKNRGLVSLTTFKAAEEAGLSNDLLRLIAGLVVEQLDSVNGREETLKDYPNLARYLDAQ